MTPCLWLLLSTGSRPQRESPSQERPSSPATTPAEPRREPVLPPRRAELESDLAPFRDAPAPNPRFVGKVDRFTLEGLVIDNYLFGVAAVGRTGTESVVSFPTGQLRR